MEARKQEEDENKITDTAFNVDFTKSNRKLPLSLVCTIPLVGVPTASS